MGLNTIIIISLFGMVFPEPGSWNSWVHYPMFPLEILREKYLFQWILRCLKINYHNMLYKMLFYEGLFVPNAFLELPSQYLWSNHFFLLIPETEWRSS